MPTSILRRVHNPTGRECGCTADCFCQRNRVGRLLRWYLPRGIHKSVPPDLKRRAEFRPPVR